MSSADHVATITILDRTFQIKCPAEEMAQLQESANYLNGEIRKIYQPGQPKNMERLVLVAALNIVNELSVFKNQKNAYLDVMHEQIKSLQNRVEKFLGVTEEATV
jgi:cell division protein ZapA